MVDQQAMMLGYYEEHQCSKQWRGFLLALAEEFEEQLGASELRGLMTRIGERFARATALPPCETLEQLTEAINETWVLLDWGWVTIEDDADYLAIRHACAPLRAAFGKGGAGWAPAFLEGVYQHWFSVLGIDPVLRVREAPGVDDGVLEFRLGR
ncbi:cellulose synthase [Robbsia sp. Bb-Pol-6]|uniref:Cellulose synthase n=1 Tax=Robbsia betulipollinis TaxID=2981849 RepID=A0ABT3ZMJ2_9BURK|nr:cellulose biosynthesis protein BcsD [Robbsia betulipollinis]MCY0387542.1 cellulose synthase [Robbsia betulipollinis]